MKINPLSRESLVLKAQWHSYATHLSFGVKCRLPLSGEGSDQKGFRVEHLLASKIIPLLPDVNAVEKECAWVFVIFSPSMNGIFTYIWLRFMVFM